jgi:hypothetical protein
MCISCNGSEVLDDLLGTLGLPCTGLTAGDPLDDGSTLEEDIRDEDTLVLLLFTHVNPSTFCNSKYMRGILITSLPSILLNNCVGIEWQILVWINSNQKQP